MKKYILFVLSLSLIFLLVGCPAVNKSPEVVKLDGASGKVAADSWTFLWSGSDADGSIIRYEFRKDFADWESNGNETVYLERIL